jgi:hypothetical protein
MAWDQIERRKESREFCSAHIGMTNDIVEIKTILKSIKEALTQGITFKTAVVGCIVLIVLTIIGQAFLYGKLCERVDRNTVIIEKMLVQIERIQIAR